MSKESMLAIFCSLVLFSAPPEPASDPLCGAYTLHVALRSIDAPLASLEELKSRLGPVPKSGYSFAQLADAAETYGVRTLGVLTSTENLMRRPGRFACIVRIGEKHFVCLSDVDNQQVHLIDPPRKYSMPKATWDITWKGEALLLSQSELVREEAISLNAGWMGFTGMTVTSLLTLASVVALGIAFLRRRLSESRK